MDFLRAPDPFEGEGHDVTMQQALDNAADKAQSRFAGRPALQAEIFGTLATVYRNLDLHQQAVTLWDKQLPILQTTSADKLKILEEVMKACKSGDAEKGMLNANAVIAAIKEHNLMQGDNAPTQIDNTHVITKVDDENW